MLYSFSYVSPSIHEERLKSRISDLHTQMLELSRKISPAETSRNRPTPSAQSETPKMQERLICRFLDATGCLTWIAWPFLFPTFTYLAEGSTTFFWATTLVCLITSVTIFWRSFSQEMQAFLHRYCIHHCQRRLVKLFHELVGSAWCCNIRDSFQLAAIISSITAVVMLVIHHCNYGGLDKCPCWYVAVFPITGFLVFCVFKNFFNASLTLSLPVVNREKDSKSKNMSRKIHFDHNIVDRNFGSSPQLRKSAFLANKRVDFDARGLELSTALFLRYPINRFEYLQ